MFISIIKEGIKFDLFFIYRASLLIIHFEYNVERNILTIQMKISFIFHFFCEEDTLPREKFLSSLERKSRRGK